MTPKKSIHSLKRMCLKIIRERSMKVFAGKSNVVKPQSVNSIEETLLMTEFLFF